MFEKASRLKVRFPFKGACSVEDLWDLSLQDLDSIFKILNSKLKVVKEESLLDEISTEDKVLKLQIDIIKHIVEVKKFERESRKNAKAIKEQKEKLMEIISRKKDDDLQSKSVSELEEMLSKL